MSLYTPPTCRERLHCSFHLLFALRDILSAFSSIFLVFSTRHYVFHTPAFWCHWSLAPALETVRSNSLGPFLHSYLEFSRSLCGCDTVLGDLCWANLNSNDLRWISCEATLFHEILNGIKILCIHCVFFFFPFIWPHQFVSLSRHPVFTFDKYGPHCSTVSWTHHFLYLLQWWNQNLVSRYEKSYTLLMFASWLVPSCFFHKDFLMHTWEFYCIEKSYLELTLVTKFARQRHKLTREIFCQCNLTQRRYGKICDTLRVVLSSSLRISMWPRYTDDGIQKKTILKNVNGHATNKVMHLIKTNPHLIFRTTKSEKWHMVNEDDWNEHHTWTSSWRSLFVKVIVTRICRVKRALMGTRRNSGKCCILGTIGRSNGPEEPYPQILSPDTVSHFSKTLNFAV